MSNRAVSSSTPITKQSQVDLMLKNDVSGVLRYIGQFASGKGMTPFEVALLKKNGFKWVQVGEVLPGKWIYPIFETSKTQTLGGHKQGIADAKRAEAALKALGAPADTPILFCCDTDTDDIKATNAYCDGAATIVNVVRVGLYGSTYIIDAAKKGGHVTVTWQNQSRGWRGNGIPGTKTFKPNKAANIVQRFADWGGLGGLSYESNYVNSLKFGDAVVKPPAPPVTPPDAPDGNIPPQREAVMRQASQLWNQTIGTKRSPNPKKGEQIMVLIGHTVNKGGNRYEKIRKSSDGKEGWVRYDHFKWKS